MKRILFFLFVLHISFVFGHQDRIISIQKRNLYLQYLIGWEKQEFGKQVQIFGHLAEKLIQKKGFNDEKIFIYFDHNYTHSDTNYCVLSYGSFNFDQNGKNTEYTGLKLIIRDYRIDIEKTLNLLASSFTNLDNIKQNQHRLLVDLHMMVNGENQFDTLYTIPSTQVEKYAQKHDVLVQELVSKKTYSDLLGPDTLWNADYYYQNNKYHFYNTRNPETKYIPQKGRGVVVKTFGEDVLVVDNVLEICGEWNYGHFVFVNDSTFYYIPHLKDRVQGPFEVDSVLLGRPPVRKLSYDDYPLKKYTLHFYNYFNETKAVFLPDSNKVISNYQTVEAGFIKSLFGNNIQDEKSSNSMYYYLLGAILMISVSFNIVFWFRR